MSAGPASAESLLFSDFIARAEQLNEPDTKYKGKTFMDYVHDENVGTIIGKFSYPDNGDTSTVTDNEGLINACYANDLYKLSMAPVVNEVSKHQRGCIVQFKVDLRMSDKDSFNVHLQKDYVLNPQSEFVNDLVAQLDSLKNRTFVSTVLDGATSGGGPAWKAYWKSGKAYPIQDRTLIETQRAEIMKNYMKDNGAAPITDADFHGETVILNCIPVPKDPKNQSTVVLSVVAGAGQKPDIRATGYWPLCSWLETPLMQSTYEVLHRQHLKVNGKTYGAWIAESLYRTFSSMCFLADKQIKVALFSGRRTGGALFNLLQVYLWNKFDEPGSPRPLEDDSKRNLGTSSFWALETLKKMGLACAIQATGTHAHELSMTLNVLYPKLDVTAVGFVGSQILGHFLYKLLSAGPGQITPMLTDTVGTESFLDTASKLIDKETNKPALCSFGAARQDSGKLADYAQMMRYFVGLAGCGKQPGLMASEVDNTGDFEEAEKNGFGNSGVGGLLGDSEKTADEKILGAKFNKTNKEHFGASMAVKIARVWSGIGNNGYTLKTGDGTGKVTIDDKAPQNVKDELEERATKFQKLHNDAVKALNSGATPKPLELADDVIADKQRLLDRLLDDIQAGNPATEEDMGPPAAAAAPPLPAPAAAAPLNRAQQLTAAATALERQTMSQSGPEPFGLGNWGGGRRTRRRARKVTKKHVRKNIRKSKHMRNRRSNRRKSKK
jgi:nicotinic acid phosphoribosyltransferase